MYKHILVPTDGSKFSEKAFKAAVRLAKLLGAKLTGIYVIPPFASPIYSEGAAYAMQISSKEYKEATEKAAKKALAVLETQARGAGLACSTACVIAAEPWRAIIDTARARKCDLVAMASHGRRGLSGLLLGSETTKVLTHSKITVLVCR
jgi:nucleotide-binding universal stress UspA family protein